jgi:hypothetical protein
MFMESSPDLQEFGTTDLQICMRVGLRRACCCTFNMFQLMHIILITAYLVASYPGKAGFFAADLQFEGVQLCHSEKNLRMDALRVLQHGCKFSAVCKQSPINYTFLI